MICPLVAVLSVSFLGGCIQTKSQRKFSREQTAAVLRKLDNEALLIGEFPLRSNKPILDGDTVMVEGLDTSLRLIGIDTEETFKKDWERKLYAKGFDEYKKIIRGNSNRPVKMATPMGDEAKIFAENFFRGVQNVRLERDHPAELRGFYGRYLAYVLVERDGKWLNYNIEAVRAGMSPYYTKYAQSRRFHKEFLEAEATARAQKIGIWDPKKESYGDYDERKQWWDRRGAIIDYFESEEQKNDNYFSLTRYNVILELDKRVGQEVVVFGSIGKITFNERGPTLVKLARSRTQSFDVVFFDKDIFNSLNLTSQQGEYVFVRGFLRRHKNKYTGKENLQIIVNLPSQIWIPTDEEIAERKALREILVPLPAMPEVVHSPAAAEAGSPMQAIDLDAELDALYKGVPKDEKMYDSDSAGSPSDESKPSDLNFDDLQ
jgi:endonuclease YncB( thermonuclease family)